MLPAVSAAMEHKRDLVVNLEHFDVVHLFGKLNIAGYHTKLHLLGYSRIDNLKKKILCSMRSCNVH